MICRACGRQNDADARFCGACGAALDGRASTTETRKVVTVVFTDVAGSTALGERLDPETLRRVMWRYFDSMQATLERHGGTVEKFIGDAIVAVFGVPAVHEDDALRAVRAAFEMREALERLNEQLGSEYGIRIEARTGVNTGEVIVGQAVADQKLATGDAVNVAARLEQAAEPGEVLLGEATYDLVREAIAAEPARRDRGEGQEPAARSLEAARPASGRAGLRPADHDALRRPPRGARTSCAMPSTPRCGSRRARSPPSSGPRGSANRASRERPCARSRRTRASSSDGASRTATASPTSRWPMSCATSRDPIPRRPSGRFWRTSIAGTPHSG